MLKTVSLSIDRREYNPDSTVYLRFDWDDGLQAGAVPPTISSTLQDDPNTLGQITLQKVDRENVPYPLETSGVPNFERLQTGKFVLLRFIR